MNEARAAADGARPVVPSNGDRLRHICVSASCDYRQHISTIFRCIDLKWGACHAEDAVIGGSTAMQMAECYTSSLGSYYEYETFPSRGTEFTSKKITVLQLTSKSGRYIQDSRWSCLIGQIPNLQS